MMKNIIIFLTLLIHLVTLGCAKLDDATVKANGTLPKNETVNSVNSFLNPSLINSQTNSNLQVISQNRQLSKVGSKSSLFWYGEISSEDLESVGETIRFASLPKEIRQWLNLKTKQHCEREIKNDLSIEEGDFWIDTDGDGKIDWIQTKGINKKAAERAEDCVTNMRFFQQINGKWKEVELPQPSGKSNK